MGNTLNRQQEVPKNMGNSASVWEDCASSLNYMLKLRGVKTNQDDLDQYLDTIIEYNP